MASTGIWGQFVSMGDGWSAGLSRGERLDGNWDPLVHWMERELKAHLLTLESKLDRLYTLVAALPLSGGSAPDEVPGKAREEVPGEAPVKDLCIQTSFSGLPGKPFLVACTHGNLEEVRCLLDNQADPNAETGPFTLRNKPFTKGTPLAVAVLAGHTETVRLLASRGASIESEYAFLAGALETEIVFPTSHATVPGGDLPLLEMLIEQKADLNSVTSHGADLLWEAAYFGKVAIAEYLLARGIEVNRAGISQDDNVSRLTPLHVAAREGHTQIVKMLIEARGAVSGRNGDGSTPVEDAIVKCHADVVRQLIANGAKMAKSRYRKQISRGSNGEDEEERRSYSSIAKSFARMSLIPSSPKAGAPTPAISTEGSTDWSLFDLLFELGNDVVIAAVAKGLSQAAPENMDQLQPEDVVRFMKAEGTAPRYILHAIMREETLRYWTGDMRRLIIKTAFVDAGRMFNVSMGPHSDEMVQLFNSKSPLGKEMSDFLYNLAPQLGLQRRPANAVLASVSIWRCRVVGLESGTALLSALVDNSADAVYEEKHCQALVQLHWSRVVMLSYAMMMLHLFQLICVSSLTPLRREEIFGPFSHILVMTVTVLGLIMWCVELLLEASQALGHAWSGNARRYFSDYGNWFDMLRISLYGTVFVWTLFDISKDNVAYNMLLGIVVYIRWMKMLYQMLTLKAVGMRILPILSAMRQTGPFCFVMLIYLVASMNLYYALGLTEFIKSILLIFRLVVLGDVNLNEWEAVAPRTSAVYNSDHNATVLDIITLPPNRTPYFLFVRILMMFISSWMGLTMMNIFIAVLSMSYSEASQSAYSNFMRNRASTARNFHTTRMGMQLLASFFTQQAPRQELLCNEDQYIWYCRGEAELLK